MSEFVQWIIVAALVAAAIVFLVKRLKPSKTSCCCAGCPYAGSCSKSSDERADAHADCPAVEPPAGMPKENGQG